MKVLKGDLRKEREGVHNKLPVNGNFKLDRSFPEEAQKRDEGGRT